ncbi:MAG: hypothetical protein H6835_00460 [Planctomycetes bacterium]|nr:hypothetical protein [Planctomycetota bacterium]
MTRPSHRFPARLAAIPMLSLALATSLVAQGSVMLYENSSFGGSSAAINLSTWGRNAPVPLAAYSFNDKATSLTWNLQTNTAVTFYENSDGSGAQWHISRNAARVGTNANIGATYNDTWSAFSWQLDDPSIGGTVTLYENSSFGGIQKRLPLSSYLEGGLHQLYGFDDKATGIAWDLQPNVVVTFYENSNGTGREYTLTHQQQSGSLSAVPSYYNDKFSSFRWRTVDPQQGWVRLFTDAGLSGYQLTRYVSETGFGATSLGALSMNDQVDSVQWGLPLGTTILLYDHDPKGGACYSLTGGGSRGFANSNVFHDRISVFEVFDGDVDACLADRTAPYDQNCSLSAHNAHVAPGYGWLVWNQDLVVIDQLDYGARTLQLDTAINGGTIYMVHGSWTATIAARLPGTTPTTLHDMLLEIDAWMTAHPREVLTLIFENHDGAELGDYLLDVSPIKDEIHVQGRGTWPTPRQLIQSGKRYVVFEMGSSPRSGRINWQYDCSVENDYGAWGSTSERAESQPIDATWRGLFYMNNISPVPPSLWPAVPPTTPNTFGNLVSLMAAFPQFPNQVGVDRIREGGEGGADAVRYANTALRAFHQNRASFAQFGFGNCGLRALYSNARPVLGTTLPLRIDNLGSNPAFEFMIYGASDQVAGPLSLPFLLPPSLGGGCRLRVSNDVVFPCGLFYPLAVGVTLPLDPVLNGVDAFFQSVGIDSVTGELVMSNGGRAHLGLF